MKQKHTDSVGTMLLPGQVQRHGNAAETNTHKPSTLGLSAAAVQRAVQPHRILPLPCSGLFLHTQCGRRDTPAPFCAFLDQAKDQGGEVTHRKNLLPQHKGAGSSKAGSPSLVPKEGALQKARCDLCRHPPVAVSCGGSTHFLVVGQVH